MTRFAGWIGAEKRTSEARRSVRNRIADPSPPGVDAGFAGPGFGAWACAEREELMGGGRLGAMTAAWIGRPRLGDVCDSRVLLEELARHTSDRGGRALASLTGAFAIAVFDAEGNRGYVATDRMGICPVFVVETDGGIAFGSAPADALAEAGRRPEIEQQAVFDYLFCHVVPAPHSVFRGVHRLLPGECIELHGGRTTRRRYWTPRFQEDERRSFEDLRGDFKRVLREAVATSMDGRRCGSFLSGGTDSSTIAGLLTQTTGQPALTFSIGFEAEGFDEMEYARLAARHFGTQHHEYYVTPDDIVDVVPRLAALHGQPFANSSAVPAYCCARLARSAGVDCLLAGDGGDELFGGNARYAKQYIFSHYERIPAQLRRGLIEPACREIGRLGRIPGISKAISYVEQASIPMPERLETYNLLSRLGLDEVLTTEFATRIDPTAPQALNREAYLNPTARSLINRMLALDFKTTLADNDLPKVMESCRLAGVPVTFPMLDHRVVDFSLALPPELKLKGTRLRYFFKEALGGFLPAEIINKKKHGFGLPFGEWAVRHPRLREMTFETLGRFKQRGWVRPAHIDRLRDELLPAVPNYYGSLAWLYMMLELWMQFHVDPVPKDR